MEDPTPKNMQNILQTMAAVLQDLASSICPIFFFLRACYKRKERAHIKVDNKVTIIHAYKILRFDYLSHFAGTNNYGIRKTPLIIIQTLHPSSQHSRKLLFAGT